LLTTHSPQVLSLVANNKVSAAGYLEVAGEPGGDFYDFFEHAPHKISFIIGDVSGKGSKAAAYMLETKRYFRQLAGENLAPTDLIERLNESVSAVFDKLHFVTLTYVQLNTSVRQFSYIRAGHCPLLYYTASNNECFYFKDKGLGLGIIRNRFFSSQIHEYKVMYNSNDILVLFTDGLIESEDTLTNNVFNLKKLKDVVSALSEHTAQAICNEILHAFRKEISRPKNPDDMALIVIKFA
jgi:serine phosphatase RsbU (regulator of sigma subunit)